MNQTLHQRRVLHDYAHATPHHQIVPFVVGLDIAFKIGACTFGFYGLLWAVIMICGYLESFA